MQAISLVSILLITLIYLHVKASHLVFQRDVKFAKILTLVILALTAGASFLGPMLSGSEAVDFAFIFNGVIWILIVIAYWKFLSGCYNDALFKRNETVESALRQKARDTLLEVVDKKKLTPEWKIFLKVTTSDALIEEVRCKCQQMHPKESGEGIGVSVGVFTEDDLEKLKNFVEQLAN